MRPLAGQYDPPADYGIPNPLGPRTHNWRGGPYNEGSLYHGPVYTRPSYQLPWMPRPLNGAVGRLHAVGQAEQVPVPVPVPVPAPAPEPKNNEGAAVLGAVLPVLIIGGLILWLYTPTKGK